MTSNLIIVSNRLPISVKQTDTGLEFYPSIGGLATGLAGYAKNKTNKWIGWPGIASDNLTAAEKDEITIRLLKNNCYPVFLTQKQLDGFYNGYSNSILWPLFHNLNITPTNTNLQNKFWNEYKKVNAIYAEAVLKLCENNSNIWVNDYQLLILPALLRQIHIDNKIGFFLHIPFPKLSIFLKLANARELTLGVLGANLVGFHTSSYAKNFAKNCEYQKIGLLTKDCIALYDRIIRIANYPMGIDYNKFNIASKSKSIYKDYLKLKSNHGNQKVILTVDRLDPTKGLIERISAYRELLLRNDKLIGKVVLIILAVPSRTNIEEYKILKEQVELLINQTNKEFQNLDWKPIEYIYRSLPFKELVPLYQLADIAFIAPLADGMNLVAKEYIASKIDETGVLILSKTAGAAEELHDALIVDPTKPESLLRGLTKALSIPKKDMQKRLNNMQKHISLFTVQHWANNFISSLSESPSLPIVRTKPLSIKLQDSLIENYSAALKRVFLLDYDGTLAPFVDKPELAKPSLELKKQLKQLSYNKQNHVIIISGRNKESLGEWFNDLPITLIVEHGSLIRRAGEKKWHNTKNFDNSWKPMISTILQQHAIKVPGSFVEQKQNSLVWHYRVAKPYYVQKYLESLKHLLQPLAVKLDLKVEQGNMILEVRPNSINKGIPALEYSKNADFTLAIGDDTTDEEMFLALSPIAWTIKVGTGNTAARYRVKDVSEVHNLLNKLK